MPDHQNIEYPHKHNFYEIFWATEGSSEQVIDYKSYTVAPNSLFFISPGQLHLWEQWSGVKGYCILFTEQFFSGAFADKNVLFQLSYLDNIQEQPYLLLNAAAQTALLPVVNLLLAETLIDTPDTVTIQALLMVLLKNIQRIFNRTFSSKTSSHHGVIVFRQFKALMDATFAEPVSISDYAARLHLSAHHFTRLVKEVCGLPPGEVVARRRLLEARQLLHFTDLNIGQVATQTGFEDASYFSRYFKRHTGCSPVHFRRQMHEKYRK